MPKRARVDDPHKEADGDDASVRDAAYWAALADAEVAAASNAGANADAAAAAAAGAVSAGAAASKHGAAHALYLDTQIDRRLLDFDFEKVCSVTLSNMNIYACLVCGKYFQGRGKRTPALLHSINDGHRVFIHLDTTQVYILPENYTVDDASLHDIQRLLKLTYDEETIARLDARNAQARGLGALTYIPGFVGLNNISHNDAMNVVVQALAHVPPLRNYLLRGGEPASARTPQDAVHTVTAAAGHLAHSTELVRRFATLVRRIWNPHAFKAQVSPHEFLQEVANGSDGRFKLTEPADPVEFLGWLLNRLHFDLAGGPAAGRKRRTIISQCFQGRLRVESQDVVVRTGFDDTVTANETVHDEQGRVQFSTTSDTRVDTTPFWLLALDLPPIPVFQDTTPQVPLAHLLAKYDGVSVQEAQGRLRRYRIADLPPYLILHVRRFTKNRFVEERNATTVTFPTVGLDVGAATDVGPPLGMVYNLLANVTHEALAGTVRERSVWRCQVHTPEHAADAHGQDTDADPAPAPAPARWFEMQDLHVDEVNKEVLFLGETYIQVWERVVLPGDGIGPEVVEQAVRVLQRVSDKSSAFKLEMTSYDFGGAAIDSAGEPLPAATLDACKAADAILLGAVGGPKWGVGKVRPEQGLLAIRKELDLYANVRPALFPSESLLEHSPLRPEVAKGTHFIVIRELVKGLYYGDRKEADLDSPDSKGEAYDMMVYDRADVQRITRLAAYLALQSNPPAKIHSIDKANVLATSRLWRRVVTETIENEFKDKGVEVDHHLVDSAAMVMVANPRKLNGIVLTENMFGDILSDESSVIPGALGLLPSASLSELPTGEAPCKGLYEPIHGSAPDIAGRGIANPVGTILSAALLLRWSLGRDAEATAIEQAVRKTLDSADIGGAGVRTGDLGGSATTAEVGDKVLAALDSLL
ncbi:3-isopropylmalate dehydrogenase [Malassezia cuniculi]|uniref:3-isopropylmalate dehydrogenase n=1 Tax=Malassezia cuniculi TaxID=948313 RepID=A0AAF0ERE7_9BASI|nr:3-isopropylmalate dehydrogenase [Malassezia cuniculi]